MTMLDLVDELLEETRENIFQLSANYHMTRPKKGFERAFHMAREREELLQELKDVALHYTAHDPLPLSVLSRTVYSGGATA